MNEKWRMPNGYQDEEAKIEANRCLSCKNPRCETGCPTHMRIRDFIQALKNGDRKEASSIIHSCSSLPHMSAAQRVVLFPADSQAPSRCGNNGSYRREHADPCRKPERFRLRSPEAALLPSSGFLLRYPDKRGGSC